MTIRNLLWGLLAFWIASFLINLVAYVRRRRRGEPEDPLWAGSLHIAGGSSLLIAAMLIEQTALTYALLAGSMALLALSIKGQWKASIHQPRAAIRAAEDLVPSRDHRFRY